MKEYLIKSVFRNTRINPGLGVCVYLFPNHFPKSKSYDECNKSC